MNTPEARSALENDRDAQRLLLHKDRCDKYDYLAAVACGAIGGLVDVFFVGAPGDSVLGSWTDAQVNKLVEGFAKKLGWNGNGTKSAIGFLEKRYPVNYDQKNNTEVGGLLQMSPKNHHMKSLAHSPDVIGLFFSILNQFTGTSSFLSNGQLITIAAEGELVGGNFIAKLFCGVANWFGHLMSDVAGSSGGAGRGTGIVAPFYELFGLCNFGKFQIGNDRQTLALLATRAFQEGYDLRFSIATAIPVLITNLSIRLIWSLRQYFQYKKPLEQCVPTQAHADLRIMLLFGNGTLCVIDAIDAGIRSGGNALAFFLRLNLVAWFRLAALVLKEILIRIGMANPLQKLLDAFKRINEALSEYLYALKEIDIELFQKETQEYITLLAEFDSIESDEELNLALLQSCERLGIEKPWKGDFEEQMSNKNGTLVFT